MLVSWFFARVLMFAFFFAHLWWHRGELGLLSSSVLSLVAIVPPSLFALNFFWFWKIFQGALKLVVRGKPAEVCMISRACKAAPLASARPSPFWQTH
jgi:hypothetical protein